MIALLSLCLVVFGAAPALAQTSATLTGTITDTSGGALPGVALTLRNTGTGLTRAATSTPEGRFVFAGIPAGAYDLRAELSGFRPVVRQGLTVTVAQSLTVPLVMEVGGVEQAVTVSGGASAVNTATSELSFLVGEQAIETLPLNGRNFTDLALLQPGVLAYPSRDGGSVVAHGLGMSVNGQDYRSNVYLLDGTLQNDFTNGPAGSAAGTTLGLEAIREFRVESNAYSAEFGRNYGGQINVLTKSGTNTLRGSAFEFHRNDALDARNYFDVAGKPDFTRNQFGASLGGPLQEDRLFYFAAYEGLRERLGKTISSFVPDLNARNGILPDGPVAISDVVRPYLNAIPQPTGTPIGGGLAPHTFGFEQKLDQTFLQGRVDYQAGPAHQFFARHTYDDGEQRLPTDYPAFPRSFISTNQFFTAEYRNVRSERTLQTARFGYSRTRVGQNVEANLASPLPPFVAGRGLVGDIDIGGMQRFGPQSSANLRLAQNVYSGQYDVTHTRGRHLFKAGALVERYRDFMTNPTFSLGIYTFANVRAFLENRATRFVGLSPQGDIDRDWPWTLFGGYVQDTMSVNRRLTLNAGLRYETTTMPIDTAGRDSALVRLSDAAPTVGRLYEGPGRANLSPRAGAAWDVFGDGSTSVRGGYGLYFGTTVQQNLIVTVTNPPSTPRFVIGAPSFPSPPFDRGIGNTIRPMQWDLQSPRLHVWNVSAQRALPGAVIATIGYAGSRGTHLYRNTDVNIPAPSATADGRPFFAAGLLRPNRNFGTIELKSSDGDSWYRALIVELRRTWQAGLSLQSSYTWSRTEDTTQASTFFSDSTNGTTVAFPEVIAGYNQGPADWDTPHTLVVNMTWDVPFARDLSGAARALLDGWQVSAIGTFRSGQPLTVFVQNNWSRSQWSPSISPTSGLDRPDLAPGRSAGSAVLGRPDQWFDPSAFVLQPQGTLGNSPRGAFRGPDLRTVDIAAVRRLGVGGGARVELRLEVFNLFNRANFGNPTLIAFAGAAANEAPLASFGRIRATVTSARQMQLGARITF
ncbi:MAG TPA: carboxypeptidase regulatory-like domain-containing protein [Vicinamibacterales bacterium]|nr:carboxypeptidase regulatory-like domain-containing protein [Vicinamibacterales bacterium]